MHFGFVASLRAQWMAVRCLNSHSRFIYFWELFFRSTSESCKCQKCDKHFVEIRFIIGPKWPHSRNWLQRDDYYPQTVCPQHASNFYEPELSWSLDFGSIFILVAGRARFTATFRFKLENLLLQTVAWLFLPFLPARSTSFLRLPAVQRGKLGMGMKWVCCCKCLSKLDALFDSHPIHWPKGNVFPWLPWSATKLLTRRPGLLTCLSIYLRVNLSN